jgi:hypothetical protein
MAEEAMGVAAIKAILNTTGSIVTVKDHEDPAKAGHYVQVRPNDDEACDMWVPWCNNSTDFLAGHYITVEGTGLPDKKYWIWQFDSYIKFYTSERWSPYAKSVPGSSYGNKNKVVLIMPTGLRFANIDM